MKHLLRILSFIFLCASLGAAVPKPILEFVRLDLLDGRKLRNVVVKSYDAKTGKVLLVADGRALTVPLGLIPPPFCESLRTDAPPSGRSTATVATARTQSPASPPTTSPGRHAESTTTALPKRVSDSTHVYMTDITATPNPIPPPSIEFAAHSSAATERARRYYLTEMPHGSVPSYTLLHHIQLNCPEPIVGWPHRYRNIGTAQVEHFTSGNRSLGRLLSTFEVITEQKPGESVQVLDFTRKT